MKAIFISLLLLPAIMMGSQGSGPWLRVNQLGYLPRAIKVAVLVSRDSQHMCTSFAVHDALTDKIVLRSKAVQRCGSYGPFPRTFRLDLSGFTTTGAYYIV